MAFKLAFRASSQGCIAEQLSLAKQRIHTTIERWFLYHLAEAAVLVSAKGADD